METMHARRAATAEPLFGHNQTHTGIAASVARMLALVPTGDGAKARLVAEMSGATRHYHGLNHLATLWERHVAMSPLVGLDFGRAHVLMASAIAYHDAVYVAGAKDNEELSALLWLSDSASADMAAEDREWVAGTIRATTDHLRCNAGEGDWMGWARQWMVDLDLTPLGEEPDVFDRNTDDLRNEFSYLTDAEWDAGRLAFLLGFGKCGRIYRTPLVHDLFEGAARANIARQLPSD
jgi:predicted metal-dependent HD superfamily phosphohydrolase